MCSKMMRINELNYYREERLIWINVPLVELLYLVFTRMPGESYRSLLLCLCADVFWVLINSPVCWFYPDEEQPTMSSVHSLQLSDVAIGGSTVFLKAGISVAPAKVRAWFFFLLCNQTSTLRHWCIRIQDRLSLLWCARALCAWRLVRQGETERESIYVWAHARVCVREREREKGGGGECVHVCACMCVCVWGCLKRWQSKILNTVSLSVLPKAIIISNKKNI